MLTYKEVVDLYSPGIDRDLYYVPDGKKVTLLCYLVLHIVTTDEEIDKCYKAIEVLIRAGADPTHKENFKLYGNLTSALDLAKDEEKYDGGKLYNFLLSQFLNSSSKSATEAPAIVNKVGDLLRKVGSKSKSIADTVIKTPLTWAAGKAYDVSKEHRKYLEDQKKFYQPANQNQDIGTSDKTNLNSEIGDLKGASRRRFISQNLPTLFRDNLNTTGLNKIIDILFEKDNPYSTKFWDAIVNIDKLGKPSIVDFVFNGKYLDLFIDLLSRTGGEGLELANAENQLRTLAFFKLHNLPFEGGLISKDQILNYSQMSDFVNKHLVKNKVTGKYYLKSTPTEPPKAESKPKKTSPLTKKGRELLNGYFKKEPDAELSLTDIAKILIKTFPADFTKLRETTNGLKANKSAIATLMDRNYKKVFKGDNPFQDLLSDIKEVLQKDKAEAEKKTETKIGLNGDQQAVLDGLVGQGIKKDKALEVIQGIEDYTDAADLVLKALKKLGK